MPLGTLTFRSDTFKTVAIAQQTLRGLVTVPPPPPPPAPYPPPPAPYPPLYGPGGGGGGGGPYYNPYKYDDLFEDALSELRAESDLEDEALLLLVYLTWCP